MQSYLAADCRFDTCDPRRSKLCTNVSPTETLHEQPNPKSKIDSNSWCWSLGYDIGVPGVHNGHNVRLWSRQGPQRLENVLEGAEYQLSRSKVSERW